MGVGAKGRTHIAMRVAVEGGRNSWLHHDALFLISALEDVGADVLRLEGTRNTLEKIETNLRKSVVAVACVRPHKYKHTHTHTHTRARACTHMLMYSLSQSKILFYQRL